MRGAVSALTVVCAAVSACRAYDRDSLDVATRIGDAALDVAAFDASQIDREAPPDVASDTPGAPDVSAQPDTGPPCTVTAVTDYCTQVPALPRAPVLDGVVDCALPLQRVVPVGWDGDPTTVNNATLDVGAAWRPDGLYLFARVTKARRDPAPVGCETWRGDSVEFYVDNDGNYERAPEYDRVGTRQFRAVAPSDDRTPVAQGDLYDGITIGNWISPRYRAYPTPTGYVVEAFIQAPDLSLASWAPAVGGSIGLDFGLNVGAPPSPDAGRCEANDGQFLMRIAPGGSGGACNRPACTVAAFCAPLLRAP